MITISCCQLLLADTSVCSCLNGTKLEFGSELPSRLGFTQRFGRATRPQARRFNLVSNWGEEEFARRQVLPRRWTQTLSWDTEADTALPAPLLQPQALKSGSLSHICDQAVNAGFAPASWKRCAEGCVEGEFAPCALL